MHIFLSHSHKDGQIADALVTLLVSQGINCWIDSAALIPGTPEWDKAIRSALSQSVWVAAICSENARESNYVAIELAIADGLKKSIYPVWVAGDVWPQCAPMSLVLSQFADLRPPDPSLGSGRFLDAQFAALGGIERSTDNHVEWPFMKFTHGTRSIALNPFSFQSRAELLTEIYLALLQDDYEPFTYGQSWALDLGGAEARLDLGSLRGEEEIRLLALPARWAEKPFKNVEEISPEWIAARPDLWSGRIPRPVAGTRRGPSRGLVDGAHASTTSIKVFDLRDIDRKIEGPEQNKPYMEQTQIVGVRTPPEVYEAIVRGGHPKSVLMNSRENAFKPASVEACRRLNLKPIELEGILLGKGRYFNILTRDFDWDSSIRYWISFVRSLGAHH